MDSSLRGRGATPRCAVHHRSSSLRLQCSTSIGHNRHSQAQWRQADRLARCGTSVATQAAAPRSEALAKPPQRKQFPGPYEEARALRDSGEHLDVRITAVNRSGAVFDFKGFEAFIPYSLMDHSRLPPAGNNIALDFLIGKTLTVKIKEVHEERSKIIASELAVKTERLAERLQPGEVVEGVISHCQDYGAFVALGTGKNLQGVQGLIHISELSWSLTLTPESVVQPGMFVRCKVMSTNPKTGKINLSLKRMEADPLLETLDAVLPAEDREQMAFVPAEIPSSVEDILTALQRQPGIEAVTLGRQVEEKRAVSQDLEIWISKEKVEDGYVLLARSGRLVQEIRVKTSLSVEDIKETTQRLLGELAEKR